MISKININNVASFDKSDHLMDNLGRVNFIFGANGSGKTTISRVLAHPENYPSCGITWEHNQVLPCKVYNADFVESTFTNLSGMPGIFTLGQAEKDVHDQITRIKTLIHETEELKKAATIALQGEDGKTGKQEELNVVIQQYTDRIWQQKQKYASSKIKEGLKGFLDSKEHFRDEVINQYKENRQNVVDYAQLEEKASTIFGENASAVEFIKKPDFSRIISLNQSAILAKKVIGKEDVDIGALIKKLSNSDWVKLGMKYIDLSDGICPFCQRTLSDTFKSQLEEYFDESYLAALQEIESLINEYKDCSQQLIQQLNGIVQQDIQFIENAELKTRIAELSGVFDENLRLIEHKRSNASVPIELLDNKPYSDLIIKVIQAANDKIARYNEIVANIGVERRNLTAQIWRFITDEIKNEISDYLSKEAELKGEISTLKTNIDGYNKKIEDLKKELEQLQGSLTSVVPMKDRINHQLEEFGFTGFRLELGTDEHSYSIVRENNVPVKKTLSEGERNFVTFLYFYSMLNGSLDSSGTVYPQVIVIDDPVSSMDSDVLFIVATLIRRLIWNMVKQNAAIKQIFILTHNIYFHKEVTFKHGWSREIRTDTCYWIVRKNAGYSVIDSYRCKNPIKSTYENLWADVRRAKQNPQSVFQTSLQNTMRRILEHYFKFYGDIALVDLPIQFSGGERIIAKSLLSWMNDGSHSGFDDISYAPSMPNAVNMYLQVFVRIFEIKGHKAHYNMMMKIDEEDTLDGQAENAQY